MACIVPNDLVAVLNEISASDSLLLCCDFDGTISEIAQRPGDAILMPGIKQLFENLLLNPKTYICIISGRSLSDLIQRSKLSEPVIMFGSHGAETSLNCNTLLTQWQCDLLALLKVTLEKKLHEMKGVELEFKPSSVAVHVRRASRETAATVMEMLRRGPACWPGVFTTDGKEVIELSVHDTHKGNAIERLRTKLGVHYRVLYIGDDKTDENAFAALTKFDVGIKVGKGSTLAKYQVANPKAVKEVIKILVKCRSSEK